MTVLLHPTSAAIVRCERPNPTTFKKGTFFAFTIRKLWHCNYLTENNNESTCLQRFGLLKDCGPKLLISCKTASFSCFQQIECSKRNVLSPWNLVPKDSWSVIKKQKQMKTKHWFQVFFPFPDFNVIDKNNNKRWIIGITSTVQSVQLMRFNEAVCC